MANYDNCNKVYVMSSYHIDEAFDSNLLTLESLDNTWMMYEKCWLNIFSLCRSYESW